MIYQEGGRWRSEPTEEEKLQDIDDIVSKLSPEEYTALEAILGEFSTEGLSEIADTCAETQWEEVPLPIEEWIESEFHVGDTGKTLFPVLKKDLIELFSNDYHEVILCLHPDTRVPLLDGSNPTIRELAERWKDDDTPYWVYSYKDGKLGASQAVHPRQTGIDDYYRVTLEDGTTFTGNARHQMLLRDGTKRMIRDMSPSDSLMPFIGTVGDIPGVDSHVSDIEKVGRGPVYCMTVPDAGNFAISTEKEGDPNHRSGVISSNTGSIGWG